MRLTGSLCDTEKLMALLMPESSGASAPSPLVARLNAAIVRWSRALPPALQEEFRKELEEFGREHDRTIQIIENIWQRRERRYAFDESTGLARRKPFHDHLAAVLTLGSSPSLRAVGLLFIDLDNLKRVNDTFGHAAGDLAVAAVGAIIREAIRLEDNADFMTRPAAGENDYAVSRHGGDEFLVALELSDPAGIDVVARRIKAHADDPVRQRTHGYAAAMPLTVSVGGVVYELPATAPALTPQALATGLIKAADEQMYASKRDGGIHIVAATSADTLEVDRENVRRVDTPTLDPGARADQP